MVLICYIFLAVIAAIFFLRGYFKYAFDYWKKRNVPYLPPKIPFGNVWNGTGKKRHISIDVADIYTDLKQQGHKYGGLYLWSMPIFLPIDVDLAKNIMTRDFSHFTNRGLYHNEKDPMSMNLFTIEDERWKNLRARLTPTFTPGKIKNTIGTIIKCAEVMGDAIGKLSEKGTAWDAKEIMACYATDIVGSCAFGIDCNSFKSPNAEFRRYGKQALSSKMNMWIMFATAFPKIMSALGFRFLDKDCNDFFMNMVKNTVGYREANNYKRDDFLQLLIDSKNQHNNSPLTLDEISGQVFVFFLAGFETTSSTLNFCLFEIAQDLMVQHKLREEINLVLKKTGGEITYEAVCEMTYMEQVINETLRKYPPLSTLNRVCNKDYTDDDLGLFIAKGTKIMISTYGIHHDAEFYPDPEKFDPERFSEEGKKNLKPNTYMPFGDGPRICIAMRFSYLPMKISLITILKQFKIRLNARTKLPLRFKMNSFTLNNDEPIYLDAEKI